MKDEKEWEGNMSIVKDLTSTHRLEDWKEGKFIPVTEIPDYKFYSGPIPSYGGAQIWWSTNGYESSTGNYCGCGVIAATNLVIYLASHFDQYRNLYSGDLNKITYNDYMKTANEMWHTIKPYSGFAIPFTGRDPYSKSIFGAFGVLLGKMKRGVKKYAINHGIDLDVLSRKADSSDDGQAANFIKEQLDKNNPVLLLSLTNGIKKYELHWVMITEMTISPDHKNDYVCISTWGQARKKVDFDELWNYGGFWENQYLVSVKM